jgi:hypothetical protein
MYRSGSFGLLEG